MPLTVQELAQALAEELDREDWGDVDPYLFRHIAEKDLRPSEPDDNDADADALRLVLERVVARFT